jgi:hypothetical protein
MKRALFFTAVVVSLARLIPLACAQDRNELTGVIGRTEVSDHAVVGTSTPGALLTSGPGLSFEVNYGRGLLDLGVLGLTGEVPFVANVDEKVHYDLNLVPRVTSRSSLHRRCEPICSRTTAFRHG